MRKTAISFLFVALAVALSQAQVRHLPAPAPTDSAADREWYLDRLPIYVNGDTYYPAGASVFFDPNTMVPSQRFDGVQLYADTTIEPFSIVLVPIGRGLLQPYERKRQGELVGTVGSRTPSFPVQRDAELGSRPGNAYLFGARLADAAPDAVIDPRYTPRPVSSLGSLDEDAPDLVTGSGGASAPAAAAPRGPLATARPPASNAGAWITYEGERYTLAGRAIALTDEFVEVGQYYGHAVYRSRDSEGAVIYVAARDSLITPYRRDASGR